MASAKTERAVDQIVEGKDPGKVLKDLLGGKLDEAAPKAPAKPDDKSKKD